MARKYQYQERRCINVGADVYRRIMRAAADREDMSMSGLVEDALAADPDFLAHVTRKA